MAPILVSPLGTLRTGALSSCLPEGKGRQVQQERLGYAPGKDFLGRKGTGRVSLSYENPGAGRSLGDHLSGPELFNAQASNEERAYIWTRETQVS